jgi:phosphoenolpyruvate carboxykinase (ATP)
VENFLSSIGISGVQTIVHNPSYDQLYEDEIQPGLDGFARGYLT